MSKTFIKSWQIEVVAVEPEAVFMAAYSKGDAVAEDEIEMPRGKFIRLFGIDHLHNGSLGMLVLKQHENGKSSMRGWPFKRKWTKCDISEAEARALKLFDDLH